MLRRSVSDQGADSLFKAQQVRAKIDEHMTQEVEYFLKAFGSAYELTLDSLMQGEA